MNKLILFFGALVFVVVLGAAFQLFGRYEYAVDGQAVWRIDRLTNQSCRVVQQRCIIPKPSTSISTSLSTSTSIRVGHGVTAQSKKS